MDSTARLSVGVVVERRDATSRWADSIWKPVSVFVGAPAIARWRELRSGDGWIWYHAATVPIELHRTDAESYTYNLSTPRPSVFIVMEPAGGPFPWRVTLATVSAYEGESYLTSDEVMVEAVPMPDEVFGWLQDFAGVHYAPQPFRKRKRDKPPVLEEAKFGKDPIFADNRRTPPREPGDG